MKRRAFTLIELLMVIMTLGLLIAILIPGIVAAMRLARRVQCANNLGWVGKQFHNYASDHGGILPARISPVGLNDWDDTWFNKLFQSYITDPKVLFCPDSSDALSAPGNKWNQAWDRHITYAILDGLPRGASGTVQDPSGSWIGALDNSGSWNLSDAADGTPQGFRGVQKVLDSNGNPATTPQLDSNGNIVNDAHGYPVMVPALPRFPIFLPNWSKAESTNMPMMGDLVVERAGSAWSISHGTLQNGDPLGMNILYADCHASWATSDVPAPLPNVDPNIRNEQRLWRRIYQQADGSFVRFLLNPNDMRLGDTR